MVVMILTSISVAMAVFILQLHQLGDRCAHVPPWLHQLVTRYLARLVGMNYVLRHRMEETQAKMDHCDEGARHFSIECEELSHHYKLLQVEGHGLYILAKEDDSIPMEKMDKEDINHLHRMGTRDNGKPLKAMKAIVVKGSGSDDEGVTDHSLRGHILPIALLWYDIAQVIDRVLFWFCFLTLSVSTVSILVIMPLSKPDPAEARAALLGEPTPYNGD